MVHSELALQSVGRDDRWSANDVPGCLVPSQSPYLVDLQDPGHPILTTCFAGLAKIKEDARRTVYDARINPSNR
jgi:hypothetical protein